LPNFTAVIFSDFLWDSVCSVSVLGSFPLHKLRSSADVLTVREKPVSRLIYRLSPSLLRHSSSFLRRPLVLLKSTFRWSVQRVLTRNLHFTPKNRLRSQSRIAPIQSMPLALTRSSLSLGPQMALAGSELFLLQQLIPFSLRNLISISPRSPSHSFVL